MEEIKKVNVKQIASFVSSEIGIGVNDIMRIYDSQFLFIKNNIKKGEVEDIKLGFFGKFKKRTYIKKRDGVNNSRK